ncbi:MAG: glycosyltransferase, partial [Clostridiales bacterium]|nr:glycosyltransferase [Clostridiales bacterium]
MRVLFTCGGTAGHINPGLALARMFQERDGAEILFVGADGGMEQELIPREGFPIRTVTISSFYRSLSLAGIRHNLKTVKNLVVSRRQA